jgi:hypothetical protein
MQSRYRRRYGSAPRRSAPAPPAPAAPAAPADPAAPQQPASPTALPSDATYQARVGHIQTSLGNTQADLAADENRLRVRFGIDDASDPFSRARQLEEQYSNQRRGTLNSMAAAGQLYSGALQNAQNYNRRNFEVSQHAMRQEYDDLMADLIRRRRDAALSAQGAIGEEDAALLDRQLAQRPEDPGPPAAPESGGGGGGSAGVSWAVWQRWTPEQRARYRDRHRNEWDRYRPR